MNGCYIKYTQAGSCGHAVLNFTLSSKRGIVRVIGCS